MKNIVTLGEVMMRLVPPDYFRFSQATSFDITYGGGEANVAAGLAQLGLHAKHVTAYPDHELGHAAANFYKKYGVDTQDILFKSGRLGTYFLEFGASMRSSKIIYDRADSVFANASPEWFDWEKIFENTSFFQWTGITPALSSNCLQITKEALKVAKEKGITVVADVNFRSNLWKYGKTAKEVMPELIAQCDIISCSEKDAYEIFGLQEFKSPAYDPGSFSEMANAMKGRFEKLKCIISTRRIAHSASTNGLKAIGYDTKYVETEELMIDHIIDRVGGGDAFLAGIIYGYFEKMNLIETLRFANAASALKHTIYGDVNLCSLEEINEVLAGNTGGRIKR